MPRPSLLLATLLLAVPAGCTRPTEPGVVVSGRVTYSGKPVSGAWISFVPDIDKPGRGGQAAVSDGRYTIPAEQGLVPGEFNILIHPGSPGPGAPTIPERYKEMNELRVTVPSHKKSYTFDFDLKPDRPPPAVETPARVD